MSLVTGQRFTLTGPPQLVHIIGECLATSPVYMGGSARPQIRWKVLSWDHSDPQRPWSLPCARCTSALGCPGHGPILGEELLQVCAPHGGQLLHHLSFDATFWHSTSPNTNEVIRCCNPSYPVRSLETAVETSNTKG